MSRMSSYALLAWIAVAFGGYLVQFGDLVKSILKVLGAS
jgi:hypothetical protein